MDEAASKPKPVVLKSKTDTSSKADLVQLIISNQSNQQNNVKAKSSVVVKSKLTIPFNKLDDDLFGHQSPNKLDNSFSSAEQGDQIQKFK